MAREDFDRRRLRAIYDRNKRRVSALADARDSRRVYVEEERAPRRYTVSERRTRLEGFGRGGAQVRRVVRRNIRERPPLQFSDRRIFRRGNRDRFAREDDLDRRYRRERFLEERRLRDYDAGRPRRPRLYSRIRRMRLREREDPEFNRPRSGRGNRPNSNQQVNNRNSRNNGNNSRGQNNGGRQQPRNDRRQRNNNNDTRRNNGQKGQKYSKDQLDAQLDNFRDGSSSFAGKK